MKYILYGGEVRSQNDGDIHFISAQKLMKLYNLNPKDCVLINNDIDRKTKLAGLNLNGVHMVLHPRYDGNYNLTNNGKEN